MSIFSSRLALSLVLAVLGLGGRAAHAQAGPVSYWTPGWPIGFGGSPPVDQNWNSYGNFPSFDGRDARGGGFANTRYNFPNGWFVGSEGGGVGLSMNGFNQAGAFGSSLYYQGVQFGYNFQNSPITVYAGFDNLKYNIGFGSPFSAFDTTSGSLPVYNAHAGVEFKPTSNLSLSVGVGFTQQSGRIDSDVGSPALTGVSPYGLVGRR